MRYLAFQFVLNVIFQVWEDLERNRRNIDQYIVVYFIQFKSLAPMESFHLYLLLIQPLSFRLSNPLSIKGITSVTLPAPC